MPLRLLAVTFTCLYTVAFAARADVEVPREEASSIKSYDVQTLEEQGAMLKEKIIKVKFNRRLSDVEKLADGSLRAWIGIHVWRNTVSDRTNFRSGVVRAIVPPEAASWFMGITTSYDARQPIVVFARVRKEGSSAEVEFLGKTLKTDMKSSRIVW